MRTASQPRNQRQQRTDGNHSKLQPLQLQQLRQQQPQHRHHVITARSAGLGSSLYSMEELLTSRFVVAASLRHLAPLRASTAARVRLSVEASANGTTCSSGLSSTINATSCEACESDEFAPAASTVCIICSSGCQRGKRKLHGVQGWAVFCTLWWSCLLRSLWWRQVCVSRLYSLHQLRRRYILCPSQCKLPHVQRGAFLQSQNCNLRIAI